MCHSGGKTKKDVLKCDILGKHAFSSLGYGIKKFTISRSEKYSTSPENTSFESGYFKTRLRGGGKMLYPQISSDWCVGWTWFDVRCISLILENVLHTHNMVFRPTENFLAASEGPTFVKISTFYHVFGASTPPSRVSIKYQKRSSLRFLLQKIISGYHTGSKITSVYSLDLREHVRYPQHLTNCHRTLPKAIRR